jgi:predicted permease
LAVEYPATNRDWVVYPVRIAQLHGRDSRQSFLLLQAAVGCFLLIACANIANLLLARGARRQYDVALRISLGASRTQVMRGVLAEALLLAVAGGVVGVTLSVWGVRLARRLGGFPEILDPQLNLPVLIFCGAVSIVTGVLCGLAPAWRASSIPPEAILRASAAGRSPGKGRLRSGLVIAQIAAALVLATSAALMVQTMINRQRVDLGFDSSNAVRAELALPWDRYRDVESGRLAVELVLEEIARQPDIAAAGAVTWALPTGAGGQRPLTLPGDREAPLPSSIRRAMEAVTPGYFAAMRMPLRAGRGFNASDRAGTTPVGIVNEELARHLWPDRSPVGERLRLGSAAEPSPVVTIVGVAGTIRRSPMHDVPLARVYVPFAQYPNRTVTLIVRANADEGHAARAIAAGVRHADPMAFAESVRTVAADVAQFVAPIRLMTILLAGFAVGGILLAGLGVFGTMSYTVLQQRRDLAVRSALGAGRGDLLRLVFGRAMIVTGAGVVLGTVGAAIASRGLQAYLYGVAAVDPITYAATAAFLVLVSLAACYRPARLAATADPLAALRE